MRNWFHVFVWKHTGWICPEWNRRDLDAMYRFWTALVEVRDEIQSWPFNTPEEAKALAIIEEALK